MSTRNTSSIRGRVLVPILFFLFFHFDVGHSWTSVPRFNSHRGNGQRLLTSASTRRLVGVQSSTMLRADPLDIMLTMYKDCLTSHPLETKVLTGGILAFLGDAIAQSKEVQYDEKRAISFVSFDAMYRAVQCSLFPEIVRVCDGHYLATLFPSIDMHSLATVEQTIANQFIVVPFIYYPVFFTFTGYLQGLSIDAIFDRAQTTLFPLLRRNWLFWIPVQYFQFGYVEESMQIPFLCVAGLAWTFILSSFAGSAVQTTVQDDSIVDIEAETYKTMKKEF